MAKIKRSQVKSFLNTGTIADPVWSLIGDGVSVGKIAYNPKTTSETHIDDDNATVSVDSYGPALPIEQTAVGGDAVFEFVDALRKSRSTLGDAETELINVWLYETPAGVSPYYYAEKNDVSIQTDDFGGEGGTPAKINYTISFLGDLIMGVFKPAATATWEANPGVATTLTTMTIVAAGLTLSPLFATDPTNLLYTASVANGVVAAAMTSTLATADSIVQYEGENVIGQGADATLAVGVNHLTIVVTEGAVVTTYRIDVTQAAP